MSTAFTLALPPSESIYRFWPSARLAVVLPQGYQAHIRDLAQAQVIALVLLPIIRTPWRPDEQGVVTTSISTSQVWAFDCCRRVLKCSRSLAITSATDHDQVLGTICRISYDIFPLSYPNCKPAAFIDLIIALLWAHECCSNSELIRQLDAGFDKLIVACKSSPRLLLECRRRLLPSIIEIVDSKHRPQHSEDLGVRQIHTASYPYIDGYRIFCVAFKNLWRRSSNPR
jgi:hypothetical protein